MPETTHHAVERIKERGGIPKRAAETVLAQVERFMPQDAVAGRFRRFLDRQTILHHSVGYVGPNDLIYMVRGGVIATVIEVPLEHRKQARIQLAKWKEQRKHLVDHDSGPSQQQGADSSAQVPDP